MININYTLDNDGFTLLPKIFSSSKIDIARKELWKVIQGKYETGIEPENRFWNSGDNPKTIIKIDKPHLSNNIIYNLICDVDFGKNEFIFVLLISTVSQMGDFIISYFKRKSKIKNTGSIIPGHGGLLDRTDGMIFALPFTYIFFNLFLNY